MAWGIAVNFAITAGTYLHARRRAKKNAAAAAAAEAAAHLERQRLDLTVEPTEPIALPVLYGRGRLAGVTCDVSQSPWWMRTHPAQGRVQVFPPYAAGIALAGESPVKFVPSPGAADYLQMRGTTQFSFSWNTANRARRDADFPAGTLEAGRTPNGESIDLGGARYYPAENGRILLTSHAFCYGDISHFADFLIDGRSFDDGFWSTIHAFPGGGVDTGWRFSAQGDVVERPDATAAATRFPKFKGIACAYAIHERNWIELNYDGPPAVQAFAFGSRVRAIDADGWGERGYSDNPALCLADYLTRPQDTELDANGAVLRAGGGVGAKDSEINLASFAAAAAICDRVVAANVAVAGRINGVRPVTSAYIAPSPDGTGIGTRRPAADPKTPVLHPHFDQTFTGGQYTGRGRDQLVPSEMEAALRAYRAVTGPGDLAGFTPQASIADRMVAGPDGVWFWTPPGFTTNTVQLRFRDRQGSPDPARNIDMSLPDPDGPLSGTSFTWWIAGDGDMPLVVRQEGSRLGLWRHGDSGWEFVAELAPAVADVAAVAAGPDTASGDRTLVVATRTTVARYNAEPGRGTRIDNRPLPTHWPAPGGAAGTLLLSSSSDGETLYVAFSEGTRRIAAFATATLARADSEVAPVDVRDLGVFESGGRDYLAVWESSGRVSFWRPDGTSVGRGPGPIDEAALDRYALRDIDGPYGPFAHRYGLDLERSPTGTRSLRRYEWHGTTDSGADQRENIGRFLSAMGDATLAWSGEQWHLVLHDPRSSAQADALVSRDYTDRDIVADRPVNVAIAEADDRYTQVEVSYRDEELDYAESSVAWPESGSVTYRDYLEEDGVANRARVVGEGVAHRRHALNLARRLTLESRSLVTATLTLAVGSSTHLVGDLIRVSSRVNPMLTGQIWRIESMTAKANGTTEMRLENFDWTARTWDANLA